MVLFLCFFILTSIWLDFTAVQRILLVLSSHSVLSLASYFIFIITFYFEPWLPSLSIFSADSVLSESDELVFLFGTYSISSQSLIHLFTIVIFDSCVALVFLSILFNYNCWLDCFSAAQHLLFYACFKNLKLASPKCTILSGMCHLFPITKANIFKWYRCCLCFSIGIR